MSSSHGFGAGRRHCLRQTEKEWHKETMGKTSLWLVGIVICLWVSGHSEDKQDGSTKGLLGQDNNVDNDSEISTACDLVGISSNFSLLGDGSDILDNMRTESGGYDLVLTEEYVQFVRNWSHRFKRYSLPGKYILSQKERNRIWKLVSRRNKRRCLKRFIHQLNQIKSQLQKERQKGKEIGKESGI